ncbi:MAG: hypothetical protein WCI22_08525 [Actinomycetota bacterium]
MTDDWNPNDPDAVKVLYDLSAWSFEQQAELASELAEATVPHTWDGTELVVPEASEAAADHIIDTVEKRLGIVYDEDGAITEGDMPVPDRIDISEGQPTTEYDLGDWPQVDRDTLSRAFAGQAVPFRWEGDSLSIHTADEAVVDSLLDLVEAGDFGAVELEEDLDDGEEGDELPFETLTTFFLASERLKKNPLDADGLEQLLAASAVADPDRPPYGVDRRVWGRTCELTEALAEALADGELPDEERAVELADALFDLLRPYV